MAKEDKVIKPVKPMVAPVTEVAKSAPVIEVEPKVDFDAWHATRKAKIPEHHRKEILWADFSAQGLERQEPMSAFDKALNKYGIKL